jgi:transcription elongation factor GreA
MKKMYQITDEGKRELEAELAELVGRRGAIADKIAEARDFGDLSENAEYDSAREEQGLVESRVAEIEDILLNAELIKAVKSSKVILGSKVELQSGKKSTTYSVVGPVEADPLSGKISNESPLGEALMGKKVGDSATINTQKGEITYKIITIG